MSFNGSHNGSHNGSTSVEKSIPTTFDIIKLSDGVQLAWREASPSQDAPVVLLLHGFPTSSFQYRNLIPKLSHKYRAPDLPGFGATVSPKEYNYTFDNLSKTLELFVDALKIKSFVVYIFDYGAPTGLRLALRRPELFKAIVTQNGNAFESGLGDFWKDEGIRDIWKGVTPEKKKKLMNLFTFESTKWQYTYSNSLPHLLAPESYILPYHEIQQTIDAQISFFIDYGTNIPLYPAFQDFLKKQDIPVLVCWGLGDAIFVKQGALDFEKVVKKEKLVMANVEGAGHFALESHCDEIANKMLAFFKKYDL